MFRFALMHVDELTRICFHVSTLIPNRDSYRRGEHKKRHIANDNVLIVFNENSQTQFDTDTIKVWQTHTHTPSCGDPMRYCCAESLDVCAHHHQRCV